MGLMRFTVSPPGRITDEAAEQAYLCGMEGIPWLVRTHLENGELTLERAVSESANLHLMWDVPEHGRVALSTAVLMERAKPYHLPLELARGKLGQLRNQIAEWQMLGLTIPEAVTSKTAEAIHHFSRAAVGQDTQPDSPALAETSLRVTLDAVNLLAGCYTDQAISIRRRGGAKLPSVLAGDLGITLLDDFTAQQFLQTFNAASVPVSWREVEPTEGAHNWTVCDKQLEWCRVCGLRTYAGPLVQLDRWTLPDWLYPWQGDFENILSFASDQIRAAVTRYRGKVDFWVCAGRLNTSDSMALSEEEHLQLAARGIELIHSLDPKTPVLLAFDQPWAEYLSRREMDFPPIHFADALVRAGVGLSGIMLEINVGYSPGGTLPRDPVEFSRRLDQWSVLGLPMHVAACLPSASNEDPLARRRVRLPPECWTARAQQTWISRFVPLILAKPYVHGFVWNQLRDSEPHEFPHGGLFDLRRHPKPALRAIASIRHAHLK